MIEGVLFDLDGTLLDLDIDELIRTYMAELAPMLAPIFEVSPGEAAGYVMSGTMAMLQAHPGRLNKEVFDEYILEKSSVSMSDPRLSELIDSFYSQTFPKFKSTAGPFSGTKAVIEACLSNEIAVGIATQPVFPLAATKHRLEWAGLGSYDLPIVSTYENSFSTKPHLDYFEYMAQRIGVDPTRCIMVGDEPILDMSASIIGMKTFYVGSKTPAEVGYTWRGRLEDLSEIIRNSGK